MIRIFLILGIICSLFFISTLESKAKITNACCFSDGSCEELVFSTCENSGGQPDISTFCADANCPQPTPPAGPITIIPTMGQWGMILAAIVLGLFAVLKLRRRTES